MITVDIHEYAEGAILLDGLEDYIVIESDNDEFEVDHPPSVTATQNSTAKETVSSTDGKDALDLRDKASIENCKLLVTPEMDDWDWVPAAGMHFVGENAHKEMEERVKRYETILCTSV